LNHRGIKEKVKNLVSRGAGITKNDRVAKFLGVLHGDSGAWM